LKSGWYPLQPLERVRQEPGSGGVFEGLKVLFVSMKDDEARDWSNILRAAGASAVLSTDRYSIAELVTVDVVIVDAFYLPPHATALPEKVAKVLAALRTAKASGPIACKGVLDISWAVQSIIEGESLAFNSDPRFLLLNTATLDLSFSCGGYLERFMTGIKSEPTRDALSTTVYSIKLKRVGNEVRFDVGDVVKVGSASGAGRNGNLSNAATTYGRITALSYNPASGDGYDVKLVPLDVPHNMMDTLVEGAATRAPEINVKCEFLQSHIVLLEAREYGCVENGWAAEGNKKAADIFKLLVKRGAAR
jgi:hypothetical protein